MTVGDIRARGWTHI